MRGRLLFLLLAFLALASPARADDISVAGRSVVRVVVVAFGEEGEVAGFGHGSGFAVGPNRIVTNAHVVAQAQQGKNVAIGVVPSEGAEARRRPDRRRRPGPRPRPARGRPGRAFTPIPLYLGPLDDGAGGRGAGLSRQCRSRHRPLGRRLYHAAAADPLGRHLLQRPPDQRHHHLAPHRQYRARPFAAGRCSTSAAGCSASTR